MTFTLRYYRDQWAVCQGNKVVHVYEKQSWAVCWVNRLNIMAKA